MRPSDKKVRLLHLVRSVAAAVGLLASFAGPTHAEDVQNNLIAQCGGPYMLCGYLDAVTRQERIPFKYQQVRKFSDGLAGVVMDGKAGFIDPTGKWAIPPRFEDVSSFRHGLAEVRLGGKSGIINRLGEMVVEPRFGRAIVFSSDTVLTSFDNVPGGNSASEPGLGYLSGRYRLLSLKTGKSSKAYELKKFDDRGRYIWVNIGNFRDGKIGLLNVDGTWKIPPQFWMAQGISDDRAVVCVGASGDADQRCGAVNSEGELVVPLRRWFLHYWRNGIGIATLDGKSGLVDKAGNLIGGRYFDDVRPTESGDVSKVLVDGRWVGLTRAGKIVDNPDNGAIAAECPSGVRYIWQDGKVRMVDKDNKPLLSELLDRPPSRKTIYNLRGDVSYELDCDRPFAVPSGSGYIVFNPNGRRIADLSAYLMIGRFNKNSLAPAQVGDKWGLINRDGKLVVDAQFDSVNGSADGFVARQGQRKFWLDASGREASEPKPDRTPFQGCSQSGAKYIFRTVEGRRLWGFADSAGREILVPRYRAVQCFVGGVAFVTDDERRQWCPVGSNGQPADGVACKQVDYAYYQTHSGPEKFADDQYESSVLWMRAYMEYGAGLRESPPNWIGTSNRF